jgi:hypothetical protein
MTRFLALAVAALVAGGGMAHAQTTVKTATDTKYARLLVSYDLDGEAVNAAKIVALADAADSTTYVIAAQPDVCRLIDATITDANSSITAGTFAVTGTDCLGVARVCTFDFGVVATRGSGVKALPVTSGAGTGCYLRSVTSVISTALTGELAGTDKLTVGYTTAGMNGWATYGALRPPGPNGENSVDPFGSYYESRVLTTSGALTTSVTGTASFGDVVVGDLLLIPQVDANGKTVVYERKVVTRISANAATLDKAVNVPVAGVAFRFKHQYFSTDPQDNLWIDVEGCKAAILTWQVDAVADTGGIVMLLEGANPGAEAYTTTWSQIDTVTVATGTTRASTVQYTTTQVVPFKYLRFGLKHATNDDADAAPEDISLSVALVK